MNKIIQILLLSFLFISCDDDYQDVKVYYKDGEIKAEGVLYKGYEHGPWIRYYKNGKKESEGDFYYGTQVGDWYWYYDNGQLKESSHFEQNDAHGLSKRFYENGKPKSIDYWAFDVREGTAHS